ncbi:hypothetical protein UJ11_003556 [Salmonella enterica subsp. enterica]|nr:hypothetical protein [Salmonella enterica subsp. enterica serovar Baguida]
MRKVRILTLLAVVALSGCAVVKSEPNLSETVALGGACAVNVQADSYQVACSDADPEKVVKAIQFINTKIKGNGK